MMFYVWVMTIASLMLVQGASVHEPSAQSLDLTFPKNIKLAFDETGDAGFLPVTGNSKPLDPAQAPATSAPPTLPARWKRNVDDDLEDAGSGEETPLRELIGTRPEPSQAYTESNPEAEASTGLPLVTQDGRSVGNDTILVPMEPGYNDTDWTIHNSTISSDHFKKNSVRYAIILGTVVIFWLLLAPIVCLFCRRRDQQKEKTNMLEHKGYPPMLSSAEITKSKGEPIKSNGYVPHNLGEVPSENQPMLSEPNHAPLSNGSPAGHLVANGNLPTVTPAIFPQLPEDIAFIDEDDIWVSQNAPNNYDIVHLQDSKV